MAGKLRHGVQVHPSRVLAVISTLKFIEHHLA
jgi:hypothetical protein